MLTKLGNCRFLLRAAEQENGHGDGGRVRAGYRWISGNGMKGRSSLKGIPGDVKKGHFSVMAFNGSELQRFVLPLGCLTNPAFLKLFDEAEEEFGFKQEGVLTLPCHIKELQSMFHEQLDQNSHGYQ